LLRVPKFGALLFCLWSCDVLIFWYNFKIMDIFHVLNRGVDKRKIFLDDQDYFRFIHDMFEFNDTKPVNNLTYFFRQSKDIASPYIKNARFERKRNLLVFIYAFCLMPNHYHLLLSSKIEKGISKFMKKLNMGYAKYFNQKYKRNGALFEGRYKSVPIKNESHFMYIPYYIHLNPLDLISPEWRDKELKDYKKALNFLENYRWSSHLDYLGEKNFPSVTQRDFLLNCFSGNKKYRQEIKNWLKDIDLSKVENIILE
jgi:putative transposase